MKIQIGICDDEKSTCADLETLIYKFFENSDLSADVNVWYDGRSLMNDLEKIPELYLLFLDIELPDVSGVEIGKHIREKLSYSALHLVFISSKSSYAMELFQIHPYDFLIKPVSEPVLFKLLKGLQSMTRADSRYLTFPSKDGLKRVAVGDICYAMSSNKKVCLYLGNGEVVSFTGKLASVFQSLPPTFVSASKSFIVNMRYIDSCAYDHVILRNGVRISISQSHRVSFRKSFHKFIEGE